MKKKLSAVLVVLFVFSSALANAGGSDKKEVKKGQEKDEIKVNIKKGRNDMEAENNDEFKAGPQNDSMEAEETRE